jgi:hypothetical protein
MSYIHPTYKRVSTSANDPDWVEPEISPVEI